MIIIIMMDFVNYLTSHRDAEAQRCVLAIISVYSVPPWQFFPEKLKVSINKE